MQIKIDAAKPKYSIDARNFTSEMSQTGMCRLWYTIDYPDIELRDGAISHVSPRIGDTTLLPAPHGRAPKLGTSGKYPAAIHERDVLDHLTADILWLDPEIFSVAVMATAEAGVKTPQHLAGIASPGKALRLLRAENTFELRAQAQEVLTSEADWSDTGPFLAVISLSKGQVRLRISNGGKIGSVNAADYVADLNLPRRLVLGADQVADEPDRPVPSPARTWRGASFELMAFDHDILSQPDNPALSLLDSYFGRVYGAAG